MNIQETTQAIRETRSAINNTRITQQSRLTWLGDKLWDLTARYDMLLREAGLEKV